MKAPYLYFVGEAVNGGIKTPKYWGQGDHANAGHLVASDVRGGSVPFFQVYQLVGVVKKVETTTKAVIKVGDILVDLNGLKVRIVAVDRVVRASLGAHSVVGLRRNEDGAESVESYTLGGTYHFDGRTSMSDLVIPSTTKSEVKFVPESE